MGEDKLTYEQRVRLEALAQTIALHGMGSTTLDVILMEAEKIEKWLHAANKR